MGRASGRTIERRRTASAERPARGVLVNDVHSRLNPTRVARVLTPRSIPELREAVRACARAGLALTASGGRHAMGGQAFGSGAVLLDTRSLDRIVDFDREARTIEVEGGAQWPALVAATRRLDAPGEEPLAIVQKQTGADRMTVAGSVSANAHGRGLRLAPIGAQVEALSIVDARGELVTCSRARDPGLFRLVLGGYGLFGVVATVTLRLARRFRVRRRVELRSTRGLMRAFDARADAGFRYGDCQLAVDAASDDFLARGVFSCYEPVADGTPAGGRRRLSPADWRELLYLAHADKQRAFERYAEHYLATDGQVYDSDAHQLAEYLDDYHDEIDRRTRARAPGSEMITELYVPPAELEPFLEALRARLRASRADVVYASVRRIERDRDSFLAWAREPWACLVLNLHVEHTPAGLAAARRRFRAAIDTALAHGGSFYLAYHRWATAGQLRRAHPRIDAFLERKLARDPHERFRSDWYAALKRTLGRRPAGRADF